MKHLVLRESLVTAARAPTAFSFDFPILHMKKLRFSKVKEVAQGQPENSADRISH